MSQEEIKKKIIEEEKGQIYFLKTQIHIKTLQNNKGKTEEDRKNKRKKGKIYREIKKEKQI